MTLIALITGAASGIGRAAVAAFAENWEVIAVDQRQLDEIPAGVKSQIADVSDEEEVKELFQWVEAEYGSLDALINNAAVQLNRPIIETTSSDWNMVIDTNLRSIYLTSRYGAPLLEAANGSIVNVSSVHAMATSVNIGAYAASKGGVLALTRALALEYGPRGVRVNAVLPGAVDTAMLAQGLERDLSPDDSIEALIEALGKRTALGRVGKPEEIASAILFLADGQQSSYITGQSLVIDGGALARLSTE